MSNSVDSTTSSSASYSSSIPLCSPNVVSASPGSNVEGNTGEWFDDETVAGFRIWQLAGIILSILVTITIALCCCIRFRVPRTKQQIEADYIRKRITRSFRKELAKIDNEDMDEMDLRRALDRVRAKFDVETELQKQQKEVMYEEPQRGFGARFNAMLHGVHLRLARNEPRELNGVI